MKIKLNETVSIDLDKLIEGRMLIQANSGGGKSWATRRIIEQAFGHVQIIVLDPEGEFGNLRSKYSFVYAGKDGDTAVDPRSAALLARRLLELKASAIVDLYELAPQDRRRFVRLFCESMVNAPKELWQDVLVVIDEAHIFAPENGESEAMGAVIDLATRGRKRGYCAILATQRISKLNKDAAAECNNKLLGRTTLDIDRKRAGDELGFTSKDQFLSLRDLEPGEFYAFGPAICRNVEKITIGDVSVKPAKRGQAKRALPAPTGEVMAILSKLADLPAEAAEEARTVAELKSENTQLKRQLKQLPQKTVENDPREIERIVKLELNVRDKEWQDKVFTMQGEWIQQINNWFNIIVGIGEAMKKAKQEFPQKYKIKMSGFKVPEKMRDTLYDSPMVPISARKGTYAEVAEAGRGMAGIPTEANVSGPEQRILDAIALSESIGITEPEQTAVAFLAGYTYGGGGFNNPRGALKTKGLVEYRKSKIALTDEGRSMAKQPEVMLTGQMLRDKVMAILPGPEQRLLRVLVGAYPEAMSNEALAAACNYANGSGGFNNPRGRLRTLGLIDYPSSGFARAKDLLFP